MYVFCVYICCLEKYHKQNLVTFLSKHLSTTNGTRLRFFKSAFITCGDRKRGAQPSLDAVGRKSDNPSGSQS